jgi:hypothetical protein
MDFFNRTKPPAYKGNAQPSQGASGFLTGLWCALFGGGAAPAYRSKGQTNGSTASEASPCWMGLSQTPQYKAPTEPPSDPEPEVPPCGGEPMDEESPDEPDVEPREIHIYPGG